jgi:predicted small lipoprotein YifL
MKGTIMRILMIFAALVALAGCGVPFVPLI